MNPKKNATPHNTVMVTVTSYLTRLAKLVPKLSRPKPPRRLPKYGRRVARL